MGSIYTNITLKGPQAKDIFQELGNQSRTAFIAPTQEGLTTVYELDSDDQGGSALIDLATDLSEYFGCPALAVQISDDELFRYWLFADGELQDSYQSPAPSLGSLTSQGGNPEFLVQYFNADVTPEEINDILHCLDQDCGLTLAADRHLALVELLGLPLCSVGYGFCDLDSGEYPEDLDEEDLLLTDVEE